MSIIEEHRRRLELEARAQEILERIKTYATVAAMSPTNYQPGQENLIPLKPLLHAFSRDGILITDELLRTLSPKEALAIELGRHFCTEFELEFGPESGRAELLERVNPFTIRNFGANLGKAITSMVGGDETLFPQGVSGDLSMHYFTEAHSAYLALTTWADEEQAKEQAATR